MVVTFGTGDQEEHRYLGERRQSSECGDIVGAWNYRQSNRR